MPKSIKMSPSHNPCLPGLQGSDKLKSIFKDFKSLFIHAPCTFFIDRRYLLTQKRR